MSIIFAELYGQKNYEKLRKESLLSLSAGGGFTIFSVNSQVLTANCVCIFRVQQL